MNKKRRPEGLRSATACLVKEQVSAEVDVLFRLLHTDHAPLHGLIRQAGGCYSVIVATGKITSGHHPFASFQHVAHHVVGFARVHDERQAAEQRGFDVRGDNGAVVADLIRQSLPKWGDVVKRAGIRGRDIRSIGDEARGMPLRNL